MISEAETKILIRVGAIWARFSERISRLPKQLQDAFLEDIETAIENRLRALESAKP
jgi:hypothetical protein